ncbi:acyl- thioesterase [Trichoderma arundinaceum]|uniref:Acyl-thioesterase n=1 Tax=Trichoderma arundinaceum TaxID=490622 RepID=A0A395NVX8_TRIAR|nr:acyl- thioesterase [Trichoderma arundinaceum]
MDGGGNSKIAPEPSQLSKQSEKRLPLGQFPAPIIIQPASSTHKSTIIFLHGRGSNAQKFHGPLLSSPLTAHKHFQDAFPNTRFVFPTAPLLRAARFGRSIIHQWFDGSADWEPGEQEHLKRSIEHVHGIIRQESRLLDGDCRRIILAGISQGCATALTSMLLWEGDGLGAFVGMCGYLPLATYLTEMLDGEGAGSGDEEDDGFVFELDSDDGAANQDIIEDGTCRSPLQDAVGELRREARLPDLTRPSYLSFNSTPVFLGHGTEDDKVECRHGHQASAFLKKAGLDVVFREYQGLGHWYSQDMLDHITDFLLAKMDS